MDKKYFTKKAKLVYKIDGDTFYSALYDDILNEALGFDNSFNTQQAKQWIVKYELRKLHDTITANKITKKRFNRDTNSKSQQDLFIKKYLKFLPKKRRKVLLKKLKKDIAKGKLNHM